MGNGWGGKRAGAGRRPKAELYSKEISQADQYTAAQLLRNAETMQRLANGGIEETTSEYAPAGTVTIKDVEIDGKGRVQRIERPAFPHLPPEQLVLVKQKVVVHGPDQAAVAHQLARIAGAPRRDEEPDTRDEEIARFKQTVLEVIGEADGETKKKIISRLRRRGAVGRSGGRAAGGGGTASG